MAVPTRGQRPKNSCESATTPGSTTMGVLDPQLQGVAHRGIMAEQNPGIRTRKMRIDFPKSRRIPPPDGPTRMLRLLTRSSIESEAAHATDFLASSSGRPEGGPIYDASGFLATATISFPDGSPGGPLIQ